MFYNAKNGNTDMNYISFGHGKRNLIMIPVGDGMKTVRSMARDLKVAMEQLEIEKADIIGVSQGGMMAEHFAIDYPESV